MQTIEHIMVLAPKHLACHTIPIYGWLTADTKGEPTSPETFEFTVITASSRFPFTPHDSFCDLLPAKSEELCNSNSIDQARSQRMCL